MSPTKPLHFDACGQLCILSVDDDSVNLMVMEQLLATFGWKIISAMSGEEALSVLDDKVWPDLIFLDFHMAEGDSGDETCRKMRSIFQGVPVPIVMCTALSANSDAIQVCLQAGASDYLLKPYERVKVINMIDKYVGHKLRKAAGTALPPSFGSIRPPMPLSPTSKLAPPAPWEVPTAAATTANVLPPSRGVPPAPWQTVPQAPPGSLSRTSAGAAPASPTTTVHTHTPSRLQPFVAAVSTADESSVQRFCTQLGLEYCGKKLAEGGVSFTALSGMDDMALRKAGIVVKAQRDKLVEAISRLPTSP